MKLLALDTATEACSAALWIDGEVRERFEIAPRGHAQLLLPMADALLAEAGLRPAQLDALAVGRGPGSFTGVRIAIGVAQGIAFGADLPVAPVSTLAALAQGACERHGRDRILAAIDARMGELYWGAFVAEGGVVRGVGPECVVPPGEVPLPEGEGWFGAGSGWGVHGEVLRGALAARLAGEDDTLLPRAAAVARLGAALVESGGTVAAEALQPLYLRDRVVHQR